VSKRFRLAHGRYNSLKERVIHGGRAPTEDFWALRDVALQVREGRDGRDPGPERLGQVDLAQVHLWRAPADHG